MRRDRQVAAMEEERYTSPSQLEAEQRVLFRRLPFIVGRESDLAEPGSFFTHDAAGVPLLVTRDPWGKVHAMLNVCRHRGTRLVTQETGHAKAFVCPYHAWTYDLCGRLGHVPLAKCVPSLAGERDESALVDLPCETRHGFIWVLPTAGQPLDVAGWLGDFDDDLASFALADHVVFRRSTSIRAANWKLVMDAFLAEGVVAIDTSGAHVRSVGARKNFFTIFPNTVLVFHPDTVSHIALFPHGLGEVTFVHTMLAPREPADEEARAVLDTTWNLIDGKILQLTADSRQSEREETSLSKL